METLKFSGWQRPGAGLPAESHSGRLRVSLPLEIDGIETLQHASKTLQFEFYGPPDVAGLSAGAIAHVYPDAGATSAEETMCPFIELGAPGLPWRYSPEPRDAAHPDAWRPWLVVVAGTTDQLALLPGDRVWIAREVLDAHPLSQSARWAHVQETISGSPHVTSRILSPIDLKPNRQYLAVVVPAYKASGELSWLAGEEGATVPVYHSWRFRTGDAGNFRDLALRLRARAINDPTVAALGREYVEYPLATSANVVTARSALVPPAAVPPSGVDPDGPAPVDVAQSITLMRLPQTDAQGRRIVQLPRYGSAWIADPLQPASGWGASLNETPRHRIAAGLGLWCGVVNQDLISDAARERAAGLFIAAQRICALVAGLAASGSLWSRHLPATPETRLQVFGPALARVMSTDGAGNSQTTLAAITDADNARGNGRPMPPALLSSAARRMLRPGTARARYAKPGALGAEQIISAANDCRRLAREPRPSRAGQAAERGLPHADFLGLDFGLGDPAHALQPARTEDIERLRVREDGESVGKLREVLAYNEHQAPSRRCRPASLEALDAALVAAFRPDANGVAARRVLGSISGLDPAEPLSPPEICPDLDLPAWRFLRAEAKEWLLQGREAIKPDDVVALTTNSRFINAFLVGLNSQALGELRWRNIPVRSGCTPLRRFWDGITVPSASASSKPTTDITGVAGWDPTLALGDKQQSPNPSGVRRLVMVFRTDLFRRYPRTLVYLALATKNGAGQPSWQDDADFSANVAPVFTGEIDADLVFFGFPVAPEALKERWVVVEEAPPGYRFEQKKLAASPALDGGEAAADAFYEPTRVLFRGDLFFGSQS
jgi:hypothetical protein